ncbi:MAG: hypothetical protein QNK23_14235 [Crocinitomicaceae bacterium]|nr:hypothetical protein [Crocinitomicaceae bacterium]
MKLGKLIFGILLLVNVSAQAQDSENRECDRMRFLAGEELKIKNYAAAAMYYLKGEVICGNYDAKQYARMTGTLRNTFNSTEDKEIKKLYADTLEAVFQRSEDKGFYDQKDDLIRAANILSSSKPDNKKADIFFRRGIKTQGVATNQAYISYFYYNAYVIYNAATAEEKPALKKGMITDYFAMSRLIAEAGMSAKTQETIDGYFNAIVQTCEDIVPELKGYMENLPEDPEMKKSEVLKFINLLDKKRCTEAAEYGQLIKIYVDLDPESLDAQMMQAKYLMSKRKYSEAIPVLKKAKSLSTDDAQKMELTYLISVCQLGTHSYTSAYNTAMSVQGDRRGDALIVAGKSVGNNANNCGASTFDRNCNYIYAVQLLEQGRAKGGDPGGAISKFKANYPTSQDIFKNGSPKTATLSCYGVTVNL